MKQHPILFSTPMVQAILEGRKTQTRRVVKPQPCLHSGNGWPWKMIPKEGPVPYNCPYGQPGDRLWVRETTIRNNNSNTYWPVADGYVKTAYYEKTIPSIHMPKTAARIWLEIEEVKVERVQDISEEDAIAEGAEKKYQVYPEKARYKYGFGLLWESLNGIDSWEANPWVWVIKFKTISTTGKPEL